jgi:UDP-glucose 4-epimerase
MRIVVTGASGNIGTALLRRLTDRTEHTVVGVVRRPPAPDAFPGVTWRPVDLTDDGANARLGEALRGADAVVHLAWGFQPSHDEGYLCRLGVDGTRRVLAAASATGVGHVVHMSSVGAYAPRTDDRPVDETWPTTGVPSSPYSRHKAAAERVLDAFEETDPGVALTRVRPGIVGQRTAGSALLRYALPTLAPAAVLRLVPVLPLDRRLAIPVVHADDVADALVRILDRRATGAFNLASEPPVTARVLAEVLGARLLHVPSGIVGAVVDASWRAHLQPVDRGWVDMGFAVPLLDTGRARRELDWSPSRPADAVMREVVDGMRSRAAGPTPVLRPRRMVEGLVRAARQAPAAYRRRP